MEFIIREALIGGALFAILVVCLAGVITVIHELFNQNE
jgi:hypothetical protein